MASVYDEINQIKKGTSEMATSVLITAIICVTIISLAFISKMNKK